MSRIKLNKLSKFELEIKIAEQKERGQQNSKYFKDLTDRYNEIIRLEANYTKTVHGLGVKKKTVLKREKVKVLKK